MTMPTIHWSNLETSLILCLEMLQSLRDLIEKTSGKIFNPCKAALLHRNWGSQIPILTAVKSLKEFDPNRPESSLRSIKSFSFGHRVWI